MSSKLVVFQYKLHFISERNVWILTTLISIKKSEVNSSMNRSSLQRPRAHIIHLAFKSSWWNASQKAACGELRDSWSFFGINVKCVRSLVKMLAGVDESPTVFERPVRSCVGVGHDPNWNWASGEKLNKWYEYLAMLKHNWHHHQNVRQGMGQKCWKQTQSYISLCR